MDHFTQFCIFSSSTEIIQTAKVVTLDYSKFSNSKFLHDISLLNWNLVLPNSNNDVNNVFSTFYKKLNKIVNKHTPFIALSRRKAKQMSKSWISKGLKGKYHANLLSFQNPKMFVCQQKQRNNCQVCYKLSPQCIKGIL